MKTTCERCGETLTGVQFYIEMAPENVMGITERYTVCEECAKRVRDFIAGGEINPCEKSERLAKKLSEVEQKIEKMEITARQNKGIAETLHEECEKLKGKCEAREMTMAEWYKWKTDKKRDPICMLWEDDDTPFWIMDPNKVHEPALLMGRLKLFTHKPTQEQCKAVKWDYIWKSEEEK